MKPRLFERLTELAVYVCGGLTLVIVVAIAFYLVRESQYAFEQKFGYGYRFALLEPDAPEAELIDDPNASLLTANPEGDVGPDDKEDGILMPTLSELEGSCLFATGTDLTGDEKRVNPEEMYRDDYRPLMAADEGARFLLFAFATPEYKRPTMTLAWEPDAAFDAKFAPHKLRLRLARAPKGAYMPPVDIDLKAQPRGRIETPPTSRQRTRTARRATSSRWSRNRARAASRPPPATSCTMTGRRRCGTRGSAFSRSCSRPC